MRLFANKNKSIPSMGQVNLDRMLLNFGNKKHADDRFTLRDLCEHLFITGSTGSGKTSTVGYYLADALLKSKGIEAIEKIGMIVFLYKSSDAQMWYQWCKAQGREQDIITVNHDDKDVFNLLDHYKTQEPINAVNALMNLSGLSLSGSSQRESEQYWEQLNRQRLHRLILLNQLSGHPLNIHTLYRIHQSAPQEPSQVNNEEFRRTSFCWELLAAAAERYGQDHPSFQLVEEYFVRTMPHMADRTQSSVFSLTSAILEPFISSPMLSNLFCGRSTLQLDELLSGKIVLLNIPIQQFEQNGKLAQIMFKYVLQKRIESRSLYDLPNPVILWMDEYQHYINPYDFLFLSTARSSRAGCVLMTQNISNLFAQIGGTGRVAEEKVNALLSLTNHKLFLAQNSFITNEFASKTINSSIQKLRNISVNTEQFQGNIGSSEQYLYQVMPREFTTLKRGGKHNQGIVEAYLTATGKTFSNGKNYLKLSFTQPWLR